MNAARYIVAKHRGAFAALAQPTETNLLTINELVILCHPIIERLHDENDHQAAILMQELVERLQATDRVRRTAEGYADPPMDMAKLSSLTKA